MREPTTSGILDDYRAFVGPADQYDLIGAAQFALLYALGLREHHRLLDIGCGSLRAGRLLIPYLGKGGYTGVDPNRWLIDEALDRQLGRDILAIKEPRFDPNGDFALGHLGTFDFVLAQGVATNTGPRLVSKLLAAITETLAPTGMAVVTFIHPGSGDLDALQVSIDDPDVADWRYPGCYSYDRAEIAGVVAAAGLSGQPIDWFHPRHQWWLMTQPGGVRHPKPFSRLSAERRLPTGQRRAGIQRRKPSSRGAVDGRGG